MSTFIPPCHIGRGFPLPPLPAPRSVPGLLFSGLDWLVGLYCVVAGIGGGDGTCVFKSSVAYKKKAACLVDKEARWCYNSMTSLEHRLLNHDAPNCLAFFH